MKFVFGMVAVFGAAIAYMLLGPSTYEDTIIAEFPLDSEAGLMRNYNTGPYVIDHAVSFDGNGSLRIDATGMQLLNLYHIWGNEEDLSFRQLVYEAKVRTEGALGDVFLVMQAGITSVPGGEMAVLGKENALRGTNDWTTVYAAAGNPGGTRFLESTLQLHIDGPGTVWIDDIKLINRHVR